MNRSSFPILAHSIVGLLAITAASSALAVDNLWVGSTGADWNTPANWSLGRVPTKTNGQPAPDDFDDAVVNAGIATITANIAVTPRDVKVGIGAGTNGQVNQLAGSAASGAGNWLFIGVDGGTGRYNLANTNATGGTFTGFGTGSGSFNAGSGVDGRIYVGGQDNSNGGTGTFNINTSGTVTVGNDFVVGRPTGTGTVNLDAGSVNQTGGWTVVGLGGNGTYNMSGGTVTTARETIVGLDPTGVGVLNIKGGTYSTGSANDVFTYLGRNGGNGTLNLADTKTAGGALTGFGLGSGSLAIAGNNRLYVGGANTGTNERGTGKFNVNTTGTVTIANDLVVGAGGGTGTVNLDAGTITTGGWNFIGRDESGTGASGTIRIGGGLLNAGGGRTYVGRGDNFGTLVMSGGEYRNTGDWFSVGESNLANPAASSIAMTGGLIHANQLTIGGSPEQSGKGVATLSGASAVLQTDGELWIGNGAGSTGNLTVSAGSVQVGNWFAVGRSGGTGVLTINGTAVVQKTNTNGSLEITNGGSTTASGIVNLDGGSLNVNDITGSGGTGSVAILNLNGGTLRPTVSSTKFIGGNISARVKAGGARIDTNGFDIAIPKVLEADPVSLGGSLIKSGAGVLTLSGANTYTGGTIVNGGSLVVGTFVPVDPDTTPASSGKLGTGNVTVLNTAITLSITTGIVDAIADTAVLSLAGGGVAATADFGFATLAAGINETVRGLFLGGTARAAGTYGSTASSATFKNDEFFSGPGIVTVTTLVPEPGTALSLVGGLGMLLGLRRRRN